MISQFINGPAVLDNTVLSHFSKANVFYLIKETLRGIPIITVSVQEEALKKPDVSQDVQNAIDEGWLTVATLKGRQALADYYRLSKKYPHVPGTKAKLGDGEASSLIYAAYNNCVLFTDDQAPRKRAKEYGVKVAGSLAILYFAYSEYSLIDLPKCNELFLKMKANNGHFPNRFKSFYDVIPEMEQKFGNKVKRIY
ncbi:twitching motility protein PilT [Parageobacillus genomosp. 1]|uniref:Twitching motility protein PilT n=1 Tax=Parageobacillus genomosp. 1 TaxID=1295642 RepID=A0ABC9VGD0_9BACL|nr:hypothetical protein [Parageobacillus genomosp. 1]EZP74992.1 twitching motility protein PilT [Parageobacillus genomosp. 1]EZP77641.1 twitching motility protein PilT [Parageobacillus genomosp. 1]